MKTTLFRTLVVAAALAAAGPSIAQSDHAGHHGAAPATKTSAAELADGEVRKVDKDAGKVTLKHGPLKSLDMPPMTMVFQVKDKALLDKVQAGDKVRFAAVNDGGKLTVTQIETVR